MKARSLLIYDGVGLVMTLMLVALGAWSGFYHAPQAAANWRQADSNMSNIRTSLRSAQAALHRQEAESRALETDIEQRGALPTRSPVESDLTTLAKLARNNRVELARVVPLETKSYPGITESKYAVEARATFTGIVGFLGDFHGSPFWADITQVSIKGSTVGKDESNVRFARFVVSLFASDAENASGETEADR